MLKKGKMPHISFRNGLENNEIPQVFKDATPMEILAIKKIIPFIKVRELPSSRMKAMRNRVINVAISDSDVLKTALTLPRLDDKLATVNLAVKRQLKKKYYYKPPELVRPKVINEMLCILKSCHKSYKEFPIKAIDILSESSKYKFITLPLAGEDEPDERLLTLSESYEKLIPPFLQKLKLKLGNVFPMDANCFINALLDQCR